MLLTLLAILTGLSWQGGGVSARAMPVTAQVSAVSALATVQRAKASAVLARPVEPGSQAMMDSAGEAPIAPAAVPLFGALAGIDRARE